MARSRSATRINLPTAKQVLNAHDGDFSDGGGFGSLTLLGVGLVGLAAVRRRRTHQHAKFMAAVTFFVLA